MLQAVKYQLMEIMTPYTLEVPSSDGQKLSELKRKTLLLSQEFDEERESYIVKGFAQEERLNSAEKEEH